MVDLMAVSGSLQHGSDDGQADITNLAAAERRSTLDPMIEARVATLEADVKNIRQTIGEIKLDLREVRSDLKDLRAEVRSDITELKVSVATLTERVTHLPTKGYIGWWITLGLSASVAALTILSRLGFLAMGAAK